MKPVYLIVTDEPLAPDVIGVFETKELAIAALKERAASDIKHRKNAVQITWITPTQYNLSVEDPGYWDIITVEIIERPLQQEHDHESSVHTS